MFQFADTITKYMANYFERRGVSQYDQRVISERATVRKAIRDLVTRRLGVAVEFSTLNEEQVFAISSAVVNVVAFRISGPTLHEEATDAGEALRGRITNDLLRGGIEVDQTPRYLSFAMFYGNFLAEGIQERNKQ